MVIFAVDDERLALESLIGAVRKCIPEASACLPRTKSRRKMDKKSGQIMMVIRPLFIGFLEQTGHQKRCSRRIFSPIRMRMMPPKVSAFL